MYYENPLKKKVKQRRALLLFSKYLHFRFEDEKKGSGRLTIAKREPAISGCFTASEQRGIAGQR